AFEKPLLQSNVISTKDLEDVFVNWSEILECNHMFLRALRVRRDMSSQGEIRMIGDILCENLPRMTAYIRFCSCQLRAASILQHYFQTSPSFKQVVKTCQMNPLTKGMPLSSFLIKPMQRITKYPLLIKKILEHTPKEHPDRMNLEEALAKAEEFCTQSHVDSNGMLKEPLIYNSLTNSLGSRKFLHHGVLKKSNSGRELVAFLLTDFLLLTSPNKPIGNHSFLFERNDDIQLKLYKNPFFLNMVACDFIDGPETDQFKLYDGQRELILTAHSTTERNLWLRRLKEARFECIQKSTSQLKRKQSEQAHFGACGRLLIVIVEGSDLVPASGNCDAFCEVSMSSKKQRTSVVAGTNPQWNSSMQFLIKDVQEDVLCFTVFARSHFSPNEFLGRSEVRMKDIPSDPSKPAAPYITTLKLREVKSGTIKLKLDLRLFKRSHRLI
ncbi:hypothetical protein B566_EDAN003701, partial [Ephemera danica]